MAKQEQQSPPERVFRVISGNVGPWSEHSGHCFTETEFKRLTPLPKETPDGIDRDTYHEALINRLVAAKKIRHDPTATATETPLNPDGMPQSAVKNPAIALAVKEELESQARVGIVKPAIPEGHAAALQPNNV
jgi:hypothetical protein